VKGPENLHPDTVFVPEEYVTEMKALVETVCPEKSKGKGKGLTNVQSDEPAEDSYEPGMKVPVSALEGCLASFIAADERRTKASTQFFADTGLMAMLCHHDHVLWLVNMTTAGERQYYALVLIKLLFMNLPLSMTVGILYDIGCQLERSCKIWGFLEEFMARIIFALAVFHAYGHQWPCQLVYHPRKCEGFGLSDGEGCECFWSAIKLLIPSMRVAGVSVHLMYM